METTPKFGSSNPAADQYMAFHLTPPPPLVDLEETAAESPTPPAMVRCSDEDDKVKDVRQLTLTIGNVADPGYPSGQQGHNFY